ncbi:MAG: ATP-binding protein [Eudoraea sp.]|nr:ATP-binding protein [Eudoraea sp.]
MDSKEKLKIISTKMYESAFHRSPDAIGISRVADGTFLVVNKGFQDVFGYSEEEIIGKTSLELGLYTSAQREKMIGQLLKDGYLYEYELKLKHKTGRTIHALAFADFAIVEDEKLMFFTARDITDKKQAEKELLDHRDRLEELVEMRTAKLEEHHEQFEKFYKLISQLATHEVLGSGNVQEAFETAVQSISKTLNIARVGIWLYNEDKTSIVCDTMYEIDKGLNRKRLELFEKDYPAYFKALARERVINVGDARIHETTREFTENYLDPLGITSMLDIPIKFKGEIIGVICHEHIGEQREWGLQEINLLLSLSEILTKAMDARERIQSEQKQLELQRNLEESNYRIEMAAEYTNVGIWDWDAKADKTIGNPVWKRLFGFDRDDRVYDQWVDRIHPDDSENVMQNFASHMQGHSERYEAVFRYDHPEKGWVWLKSIGKVIERDQNSEPLRMLGTTVDVSAQKKAEKNLEDTLQKLKASNTELENFAYVASHDLQEPLRKIRSYIELLQMKYAELFDEKASMYFEVVASGAIRMQELISNILSLSRITTRGEEFGTINSSDLVSETLDTLEISLQEQKAKVIKQNLPEIFGDKGQLRQVFQNLISNAIKFRAEADPEVEVSASEEPDSWTFHIKDNGIGFDPKHAEEIFEVFHRLHSRDKYSGTGIGLAICKKIIERHGGKIWAESEPGKGTVFHFSLPKRESNT